MGHQRKLGDKVTNFRYAPKTNGQLPAYEWAFGEMGEFGWAPLLVR